MRDIILLSIITLATFIGFRRPSFGLMTFVFLGFFNPQSFTWGFARTFPFSQIVAISTILGIFISSERKALTVQRETVLLILLWIVFGMSTYYALYAQDAWDRYISISKIFLMIVVATFVITNEQQLFSLIRVIGYSLGFFGLKGGLFSILSGGGFIVYGPEGSFLTANNSIGLALAMNLPILMYLQKYEQSVKLRRLIQAMLIFSYPAIVCTYSRGAWLGMGVVTIVSVLKSRKKFIMIGGAAVVAMLLMTIAPRIAPDNLVQRYDDLVNYEQEESAQSRFWNWEFCKRVGLARPLIGGGFDFYTLETYAEFYPEFQERWPGKVWACHSSWLTVFGEHGFSGSIIWLSLLASCLVSLAQIRKYALGRNLEAEKVVDFVEMIKRALIGYFVVGTFLDAAYFDLLYYLLALVVIQKSILVSAFRETSRPIVPRGITVGGDARNQLGVPKYS